MMRNRFSKSMRFCIRCISIACIFKLTAAVAQIEPSLFPDAREAVPKEWSEKVFHLSQHYPDALPPDEDYPWKNIDPTTRTEDYLRAVLSYGFEGSEEVD
jgi:hypothetical protein